MTGALARAVRAHERQERILALEDATDTLRDALADYVRALSIEGAWRAIALSPADKLHAREALIDDLLSACIGRVWRDEGRDISADELFDATGWRES